LTHWQ